MRAAWRAYPRIMTFIWLECKSAMSDVLSLSQRIISVKMRKPHKTLLLVCTLFFTNTITLNLPSFTDLLGTPTSIGPTANLTNSENLLPHAPIKKHACYPSHVPVAHDVGFNCTRAISQIPREGTPRMFDPDDFPVNFAYGGCTVRLTLLDKDNGTWWAVDLTAVYVWTTCKFMYPDTLRGATGFAGYHQRMFVRIWYEGPGNAAEDEVTAREIGGDGVERGNQLRNLSEGR